MIKKIAGLALVILSLTLQGCFFVAGAAAGAAAIAIVYDQRTVDSILQDQRIAREAQNKIHNNPELRNNTHINVTSFGQVVLLTGETPTAALRNQVEEITRSVKGIVRIYNAITIQDPTSALTQASDSWITAKIKTDILATKGLKSASIKVITENGSVYLMGTITAAQENNIINIARHTAGVQKVVKIFQYEETDSSPPYTQKNVKPLTSPQPDALLDEATTHPLDENQPLIP